MMIKFILKDMKKLNFKFKKDKDINCFFHKVLRSFEYILAGAVIIALVFTFIFSVVELYKMNWLLTETFYEMIHRAMAIVIALEFIRMLITHKLNIVLELLAFVIARKMLLPGLTALDILLSIIAFVFLITARFYIFGIDQKEKNFE